MRGLYHTTRHIIAEHRLIPAGSTVIAGVSGGPDSLALLHILRRLGAEVPFHLHVATLDHGLRGEAGAADARFVADLCAAWDIPVTLKTLALSESSEEAARSARYAFLAEVAQAQGAQYVAVGHHADDQAETVLMRLIRGTGLRGLAGMRLSVPLPSNPALTLLRPLLYANRAEIENYCREQGLEPRRDQTNADPTLLRNRLRLDILPQLRQINPQVDYALAQLADHAALDQDYIAEQVAAAINGRVEVGDTGVTLPREAFATLHPALRPHYVLWALEQLGAVDVAAVHVQNVVDLALSGETGQRSLLPGGWQLRLDYGLIVIEAQAQPLNHDAMPLLPEGTMLEVSLPGQIALPGSDWLLESSYSAFDGPQACLKIVPGQALRLRTRQPGDRFAPPGLNGHRQKLKKWLIDHKVPRRFRDHLPLITVDGEIAAFLIGERWVIGAHFAPESGECGVIYLHVVGPEAAQANS